VGGPELPDVVWIVPFSSNGGESDQSKGFPVWLNPEAGAKCNAELAAAKDDNSHE
jgi:hypothetical protein